MRLNIIISIIFLVSSFLLSAHEGKIAFYNLKKCAEYHPLSVEGYNDLKDKEDEISKELKELMVKINKIEDQLVIKFIPDLKDQKIKMEETYLEKKESLDLLKKIEPKRIMQMMEFSINRILKKIAIDEGYVVILPIQPYVYIDAEADITDLVIRKIKGLATTNWKEDLLKEINREPSLEK